MSEVTMTEESGMKSAKPNGTSATAPSENIAPRPDDSAMDVSGSQTLANATDDRRNVSVAKPIPYTFDLGNLLCTDANPLPPNPTESAISSAARDCAQALVNQLLTTCTATSTPAGVLLSLPDPSTPLPREKPLPTPKPPTKWELFAAKKGIKDRRRAEGNKVFDEASGEWVPRWGFGGKNKELEGQWLVEVDEKKEGETGKAGDARAEGRRERKEKLRRNERRMRANERRAAKGSG